jgi:hypothetical protein
MPERTGEAGIPRSCMDSRFAFVMAPELFGIRTLLGHAAARAT